MYVLLENVSPTTAVHPLLRNIHFLHVPFLIKFFKRVLKFKNNCIEHLLFMPNYRLSQSKHPFPLSAIFRKTPQNQPDHRIPWLSPYNCGLKKLGPKNSPEWHWAHFTTGQPAIYLLTIVDKMKKNISVKFCKEIGVEGQNQYKTSRQWGRQRNIKSEVRGV